MDKDVLDIDDVDLEDGELSDSSGNIYTPLQRPALLGPSPTVSGSPVSKACNPLADCHQMQQALEEDEDDLQVESSSASSTGESSDCLKKPSTDIAVDQHNLRKRKKRVRRTVMVRVQPKDQMVEQKRARFRKYDIWTAALQEEALTENMRGCDVTPSGCNDRNVENYDFSLRYRLNGENALKRRLSNSTDDLSEGEQYPLKKRGRPSSRSGEGSRRRSVKSRLGHRSRGSDTRGSAPTSGSENSCEPRHILDLKDIANREPCDIAKEISNKLFETKDDLLVRIVEVLGTDLPIEIFKETQRIEAGGGMMIKNGARRRTPGGVFLFLLKNDHRLTIEQQKAIFAEERQNSNKWHKEKKSMSRDRKVEELKKRLSKQEKELSALNTRKDLFLLGSDLSVENQATNISNPPPSPVGHDHSPEYKTHAINHVITDVNSVKPSTSASALAVFASSSSSPPKELPTYDEDFLDVNCGEMDFF